MVDKAGKYHLSFRCVSSPAEYDFTFVSAALEVYPAGYVQPAIEVSKKVTIKFDEDYSSIAEGQEEYIGTAVYNQLWPVYPQVVHRDHEVYEGRMLFAFTIKLNQSYLCQN